MKTDFGSIAQLVIEGWEKDDLSGELYFDGTNKSLSRGGFIEAMHFRQQQLEGRITAGDKVLIASGRAFAYFVDMFVVWSLGGVVVPFSIESDDVHVQKLASISEAKLILDGPLPESDTNQAGAATSGDDDLYLSEVASDFPGAILFTSGTTGDPKGVVLSHYTLVNNSLGILEVLDMSNERLFVNVPYHFTSCICHFLACCFSSSTFIGVEEKLIMSDFSKKIIDVGATGVGGAPVQARWILDYLESNSADTSIDAAALRFFVSSGDNLSRDIISELLVRLPALKIFTVYGLTELGGRFCVLDPKYLATHTGSVGKPIKGLSVKVYDQETDTELPNGEEGEIVAIGSLMASGYYNNPIATEKSFRSIGFRTGDVGRIDKDGFVFLSGRSDDVFKVNGKKVSALLIMDAMRETSFFADLFVMGIDIPVFGTVPIAFCVAKEQELKRGRILKELRKKLPNNHLPHEFVFVESIQRTGSGKAERNKLRNMFLG